MTSEENLPQLLSKSIELVKHFLQNFALFGDVDTTLNLTFGDNYNKTKVKSIVNEWQKDDFKNLPKIEIIGASILNGANAGYSISTNAIYISDAFLLHDSIQNVAKTLIEEIGHQLDAQINTIDPVWDEGNLFANLIFGNQEEFEDINHEPEDDFATIYIDGELIEIEQDSSVIGQWGGSFRAVRVVGNYAYIANSYGLLILDISNPTKPVEISRFSVEFTYEERSAVDVEVVGNIALIADSYNGLVIIDISNPSSPTFLAKSVLYVHDVEVKGNVAFIADRGSLYPGGLYILDISNPSTPTFLGGYGGFGTGEIEVFGDLAFISDNDDDLVIIDITNFSTPTFLSKYDTPARPIDIEVFGDLVFIADGVEGLIILDITNPSVPTFLSKYDTGYAVDVEVRGNLAFVGGTSGDGLTILDITNPSAPKLFGHYNISGDVRDIDVRGNHAFVTDTDGGLIIVDIATPPTPTFLGQYNTAYFVNVTEIVGNLAFVSKGLGGLAIIDVSNPSTPTFLGSYYTSGFVMDVAVFGNLAFVADNEDGLVILDVSNPSVPTFLGKYDTSGYAVEVKVSGNLAFFADSEGGLVIVDVSNPSVPTFLGKYDTDTSSNIVDVEVFGNLAFITDSTSGLVILDITNASAPAVVGKYASNRFHYIEIVGDLAFIVDDYDGGGLVILDIANPSLPTLVSNIDAPFFFEIVDLEVAGDLVFVTSLQFTIEIGQFSIIDISNPSAPSYVGSYTTSLSVSDVEVVGDLAFVSEGSLGLEILDISNYKKLRIFGTNDNDMLTGRDGNDTINGGMGNDTLYGFGSHDILIGGIGDDSMIGGLGSDTFYVDSTEDQIIELSYQRGDRDIVRSTINYTLPINVEDLILEGTKNINGTGNAVDNSLTGNNVDNQLNGDKGSDTLNGRGGNDTLNGGSLYDTLIGGKGNDTFYVDHFLDKVVELLNEGTDTVRSTINYTLGENVETLILQGAEDINGTGNSLNNSLTGNNQNNYLSGGDGNDSLIGGNSNDTLVGDNGNDRLNGGTGFDRMLGGLDNDAYSVDDIKDEVIEIFNQGIDTVFSTITYTLPSNIENLILSETVNIGINGTGNSLNNSLTGNSQNNHLSGQNGNDSLIGGNGNDTLVGGNGNDRLNGSTGIDRMLGGLDNDAYSVDNIKDEVIEFFNQGIDTVFSTITYTLASNVENLTLSETVNIDINGTGNSLNNRITGNRGNNRLNDGNGNDTLVGGNGNDILNGGVGNDSLIGGIGNDTYYVENTSDRVVELANEGTDTIRSTITYTLGANVENLVLEGIGNINGTGNTLNNSLTGNNQNNILNGGDGNDTLVGNNGNDRLNGTTGSDRMLGGFGNDAYSIDNIKDGVIEFFNQGIDIIFSTINYTLPNNIENLNLSDTVNININGTGNSLKNRLTGNNQNNRLHGGEGNDTLNGRDGNDIITGGIGNDSMIGGGGNDTYYVDITGDRVVELSNEGTDTVRSTIAYTLAANVEYLVLEGTGNINGTGNNLRNNITGNNLNNHLTGGEENDSLNGRGGNDTLTGGLGNDSLIGGTGNDSFRFTTVNEGTDTITDFNVTDDTILIRRNGFSGGLSLGTLPVNQFRIGSLTTKSSQRFIYNPSNGAFFFDSDGNGASEALKIATLTAGLDMTNEDILII
ncbi:hypothetical protein [Geminocystis sp. NIES-3709]|uniref:hypothetical protein n=1 Tax=Geminocystis sp. NIES-3709 TaxID=1617448 RepID=UPI0005FCC0AE|nr:hypothetical protein [Geminocystis sp. NIES-3709]BAQ65490.1 alkaline phosphatase [Geminocystis sp. NIES-3709]